MNGKYGDKNIQCAGQLFLTTSGTSVCFAAEPLGTHANLLFGWALAGRLWQVFTLGRSPPKKSWA